MKRVLKSLANKTVYGLMALASLAVWSGAANYAHAQSTKPVLVVALPSQDELLSDADFIGTLGGRPGARQMLEGTLQMMTQGKGLNGLDKSKPLGFVVSVGDDGQFTPTIFLPVTNTKDLLTTLSMLNVVTPPQEDGGALKFSAANQEVYAREQSGWAFITQTKDAPLPSDDPMKLMAGLSPDYDLGVRIMLQNVPADKKKSAIEQFRGFMQFAAAQQAAQPGDNPFSALSQKNLEQQVAAIERLLNQADQLTIGWKLDRAAKNTYLDFAVTAVPGSELDGEMKQLADVKTNFAGFWQPDAAATLLFAAKNSQANIDQTLNTLDQLKAKADDAIDKDQELPDDNARAAVKNVLHEMFDVATATAKTGKSDGGALAQLGAGKLQVVAGGFVADGTALEKAVKDLVTLAQGEPQFQNMATVKLDMETYKDVRLHQISIKLPPDAEEEARKIFGDAVNIYFGAGQQCAYVAVGTGSVDLLKQVIDRSASEPNKSIPPVQFSLALTPILDFAASVNDQAAAHIAPVKQALSQAPGKDHVLVNAKVIPNGLSYRFMVEEGILDAVGFAAAQGAQHGRPGP